MHHLPNEPKRPQARGEFSDKEGKGGSGGGGCHAEVSLPLTVFMLGDECGWSAGHLLRNEVNPSLQGEQLTVLVTSNKHLFLNKN